MPGRKKQIESRNNKINLPIFTFKYSFIMKKLVIILMFVIPMSSFVYGQRLPSPKLPPSVLNADPGFINITEITYGFGLAKTSTPYAKYVAGITNTFGYQINRNFITGGGIGALIYNDGFLVPLYLNGRFAFLVRNRELSPYITADAGMLLNFEDLNNGTMLFINPGAGARYTISRNIAATLGLGLFVQTGPEQVRRDSFINLKAGISFLFN
jgi:hypothetical protein